MLKLIKRKIEAYLVDKVENDSSLLNKNPILMYKLCEKHPELVKNARGLAASLDLFKLALDKSANKEKTMHELLKNQSSSFSKNPECIKIAVENSGSFLKYARGKGFTLENYLIATNHQDESKRISPNDVLNFMRHYWLETPISEMKKLINHDGRFLQCVFKEKVSKDLIEIAFNNPDTTKRPNFSKLQYLARNKNILKDLIKLDALYYVYVSGNDKNKELLSLALNQKDSNRALAYERIPKDFTSRPSYQKLKELIKIDKRWLNIVATSSMPRDLLISALKDVDLHIVPLPAEIELFDNDILSILSENAKKGKYNITDYEKMIRTTINSKLIYSDFFKEMSKKICAKANVDLDFFNYHVERALKTNDEILLTLRLDFLNSRFHKIYEKNGYEKLYVLAMYPEIQESIIQIGNPKREDGSIDIELGNKKLELLSKMLEKCNLGKTGQEHKEWTVYYNQILNSFHNNSTLYNDVATHINDLDDKLLERLVTYSLGSHQFEIKTIEELKNYNQIRNNWIDEAIKSHNDEIVKGAVLEKSFGISYKTAETLYRPYIQGIKRTPELFPKEVVDFYSTLDIIFKEENLNVLKKTIKMIKPKGQISEIDIVHFRTMLKGLYVQKYNETLYTTTGKTEDEVFAGVKIFKAAGKDGDKPFNISLHSLGAYSDFDPIGDSFSFKEDWNRPKMNIHGICTSYVGNNNLGIANIKYTVLGFVDYEEDSLLLSGPKDLASDNQSFSIIEDEDYKSIHVMPKDMVDMTRHTHNEMVYKRNIGTSKRQPNYVVLVCDEYERLKKEYEKDVEKGRYKIEDGERLDGEKESDLMYYALKAAKDFGIPIVLIEREKIAKHEHQVIQSRLNDFIKDEKLNRKEIQEYFHDLITNLENNHAGSREHHEEIDKKYFNSALAGMIEREIKEKINNYMQKDSQLALIMIEELEKVFEKELECERSSSLFDIAKMQFYCEKQKEKLPIIQPTKDNILDEINKDSYLMEFSQVFEGKVEEQISIKQVRSILDINHLNLNMNRVDSLYPNENQDSIKNTILFSMLIGKSENLSEAELDILLTSALYRNLDLSILDSLPKEDISLIKAVIELNKASDSKETNKSNLEQICSKYNIDLSNKEKVKRLKIISECLSDACELDKAKNNQNSPNYINPSNLHRESSKKMVKVALQISERKAQREIENICYNNQEVYDVVVETLQKYRNPKQVLELYKQDKLKVSEEGYFYEQSTKK